MRRAGSVVRTGGRATPMCSARWGRGQVLSNASQTMSTTTPGSGRAASRRAAGRGGGGDREWRRPGGRLGGLRLLERERRRARFGGLRVRERERRRPPRGSGSLGRPRSRPLWPLDAPLPGLRLRLRLRLPRGGLRRRRGGLRRREALGGCWSQPPAIRRQGGGAGAAGQPPYLGTYEYRQADEQLRPRATSHIAGRATDGSVPSDSHPPLAGGQAPGGQPQSLATASGFCGQSPLQAVETPCARNGSNGFNNARRARHRRQNHRHRQNHSTTPVA